MFKTCLDICVMWFSTARDTKKNLGSSRPSPMSPGELLDQVQSQSGEICIAWFHDMLMFPVYFDGPFALFQLFSIVDSSSL